MKRGEQQPSTRSKETDEMDEQTATKLSQTPEEKKGINTD